VSGFAPYGQGFGTTRAFAGSSGSTGMTTIPKRSDGGFQPVREDLIRRAGAELQRLLQMSLGAIEGPKPGQCGESYQMVAIDSRGGMTLIAFSIEGAPPWSRARVAATLPRAGSAPFGVRTDHYGLPFAASFSSLPRNQRAHPHALPIKPGRADPERALEPLRSTPRSPSTGGHTRRSSAGESLESR
jgi:hypothetical protein